MRSRLDSIEFILATIVNNDLPHMKEQLVGVRKDTAWLMRIMLIILVMLAGLFLRGG